MKISEVIEELTKILKENGDIDVQVDDDGRQFEPSFNLQTSNSDGTKYLLL